MQPLVRDPGRLHGRYNRDTAMSRGEVACNPRSMEADGGFGDYPQMPDSSRSMEMDAEGSFVNLPTAALEPILLRIVPSSRRRIRLVCRHWRDVVDERASMRRGRAKALVFVNHRPAGAAAYVLDDDLVEGRVRELWSSAANPRYSHMRLVGTCNGILCLYCDMAGDIVLLNPVTGEALGVPGPPGHWLRPSGPFSFAYHEVFSFTYHEATERYKIAHLAVDGQTKALRAVLVLTLGEDARWRNVAAPGGSSCCLLFGVVSDDQATYWITDDVSRLMTFDLADERVATDRSLPAPASKFHAGCLRKVHGRLCVAASTYDYQNNTKTEEMWLLEHGGWLVRERWCHWFYVMAQLLMPPPVHQVMWPHFAQDKTTFLGQMLTSIFNVLGIPGIMTATAD